MAFTTYKTWVNGDVDAAEFNEQIRDNGNYGKDVLDLIGATSDVTLAPIAGALYGARAVRTASQTLSDATDTAIAFTATDAFDSHAFHDTTTNNSRLTFPAGGDGGYLLGWGLQWAANNTNSRRGRVLLNGATQIEGASSRVGNAGGAATMQNATTLYQFVAGDYIELFGLQNSGGALNVDEAVFWVARLFKS